MSYSLLRRCGQLLLVGIGGAALLAITEPIWIGVATTVDLYLQGAPHVTWLATFLLLLVAGWIADRRLPGILGIRHFRRYPPSWVAAFVGVVALEVLWAWVPALSPVPEGGDWGIAALTLAIAVAVIGLGVAADVVGSWLSRSVTRIGRQRLKFVDRTSVFSIAWDFPALQEWLRDDDPISSVRDDRFGLAAVARRIIQRVTVSDPLPTIAVVGRLGAGKSSLLHLVTEGLRRTPSTAEIVQIRLWQYDSTQAAAAGIIDSLLARLGQHVNTVGITGLSARYIAAIEGASGLSGTVLQILLGTRQPSEVLESIDPIVEATGVSFILWVEDLERFADDEDRRGPIRALLYQLDQRPRISVILATTSLDARFDVEKLARFVERIPDLSRHHAFRVLRAFVEGCRPRPMERPGKRRSREQLNFDTAEVDDWFAAVEVGSGDLTPAGSLTAMCRTPRALKQALRHCLFVWDALRGEIDFDDVLIMSVVRETKPDVFSLVDEYAASLRMGEPSMKELREEKEAKKKPTAFNVRLNALLSKDVDSKHVRRLIEFVFPKEHDAAPLQGMRNRARNYWQRFLAVPTLKDVESDQELISILTAFQSGDEGAERLAHYVIASPDDTALHEFCGRLQQQELEELLSAAVDALLKMESMTSDDDGHPSGLLSIWRLMIAMRERNQMVETKIAILVPSLVQKCLPEQLFLAHELVHWFGEHEEKRNSLVSNSDSERVRAEFEGQLLLHFGSSAANPDAAHKLITALRGSRETLLHQALWGLPRIRSDAHSQGIPFERWDTVRQTILDAAAVAPEVMLGPIAWMVAKDLGPSTRDSKDRASFQRDVAERLFGLDILLKLFEQSALTSFHLAKTTTVYECVKRAASDPQVRNGLPYGIGDQGPEDAEYH
jgi:hypothetical protein